MPFDMTKQPRKRRQPKRPQIDRDALALAVQKELGRPLSWAEYVAIWNKATAEMDRKDFLK